MLVQCPECHDKMSSTLSACPHCGYVITEEDELLPFTRTAPEGGGEQKKSKNFLSFPFGDDDDAKEKKKERKRAESYSYPFEKDRRPSGIVRLWNSFFGFCKELFLLIVVLVLVIVTISFFLLRTNLFSSREKIHKLCETDSGSGSQVDTSTNRIMVKHYISKYVDCIEKIGSDDSPAPATDQNAEKQEPQGKEPQGKEPQGKEPANSQKKTAENPQTDIQRKVMNLRKTKTNVSEELPPEPPDTLPEDDFYF